MNVYDRARGGDRRGTEALFGVIHFAGEVVYDATEFVEKNRDEVPTALHDLVLSSNDRSARARTLPRNVDAGASITVWFDNNAMYRYCIKYQYIIYTIEVYSLLRIYCNTYQYDVPYILPGIHYVWYLIYTYVSRRNTFLSDVFFSRRSPL